MTITQATIRSDVAFRYTDKTNNFISNTEIDRWTDSVQKDIAQRTRFLKQDKGLSITANQPFVNMPADCIAVQSSASYQSAFTIKVLPRARWYRDTVRAAGLSTGTVPIYANLEYTRINAALAWRLNLWPVPTTGSSSSTLNGAITSSATSLILTDATNFPAAGRILIESEEIQYTTKSSNTLSGLTRGMGATIAASHADLVAVTRADIVLVYCRYPVAISTGFAEIPDEDYETLIAGILAVSFGSGRDKDLRLIEEAKYKAGLARMTAKFTTPDEDEDNVIHPSEDNPWSWGGSPMGMF